MRIVFDLQGAQTSSRLRGIGRYTIEFVKACLRNRGSHEIFLVLSNQFPDTINYIREEFSHLLPREHIFILDTPGQTNSLNYNVFSQTAELLRESFFRSLNPDIIHVCSLFESEAITSINKYYSNIPTSVILYDLIPNFNRKTYLPNLASLKWYDSKLEDLKRANLVFSISESVRREGIDFGLEPNNIINIFSGSSDAFKPLEIDNITKLSFLKKYGIFKPFLLHIGASDPRKNFIGLINAYGRLSPQVQQNHQLVLVTCKNNQEVIKLAQKQELNSENIIFLNSLPDSDLNFLYNLCKLFVFPSLHEGFGLPILEAMQCGAPVICSNNTSLPEVVDYSQALFDPFSINSIRDKIEEVLTNEAFRQQLISHSLVQVKNFSWDITAQKAIGAFESLHDKERKKVAAPIKKQNLAFICALNPDNIFFAFYSKIIAELASYYDIYIITPNKIDILPFYSKVKGLYPSSWLILNQKIFTRIIYFLSDTEEHQFILSLLKVVPGILVLHDFYLGNLRTNATSSFLPFEHELYTSYGYQALVDLKNSNLKEIINKYPLNHHIINLAQGVIVQSETSYCLAKQYFDDNFIKNWRFIPCLTHNTNFPSRDDARNILKIPSSEFIVCCFGVLDKINSVDILVNAWLESEFGNNRESKLVLIGEIVTSVQKHLKERKKNENLDFIRVENYENLKNYKSFISACDLAIILPNDVKNQSSVSVDFFNCLQNNIPLLINDIGFFKELPQDIAIKIDQNYSFLQLKRGLNEFWHNTTLRKDLITNSKKFLAKYLSEEEIGSKYLEAIEYFSLNDNSYQALFQKTTSMLKNFEVDDNLLIQIAKSIVVNTPLEIRKKQLFIDITELSKRDSKTGIQRVVRSILKELINMSHQDFRIEPVYIKEGETKYRYARNFISEFFSFPQANLKDDVIITYAGDIFFILDLNLHISKYKNHLNEFQNRGVFIYTCVYDLLPLNMPKNFISGTSPLFEEWFETITQYDGLICISRSVADEVIYQLNLDRPKKIKNLKIGYFHLGSEINPPMSNSYSSRESLIMEKILEKPSFLMVSTIEPRKGYLQAIGAFELLWGKNIKTNLIIVGKKGWLVDELVKKIDKHPELNKQLFWLEQCDDSFLTKLYQISSCLICASEGEGFGLSIVEAAYYNLPLLIRNLPVFQEIAGEHATYFSGNAGRDLSDAIEIWLDLYQKNNHPKSENIPYLTWKESAEQLMGVIAKNNWYGAAQRIPHFEG